MVLLAREEFKEVGQLKKDSIPEFAPAEHSFAVFLDSLVVSLLHVAHQPPVNRKRI